LALASVQPHSELQTEALSSSPSIAVLPFVNLSEEKGNEYFCDGLAEELLNALGKIEHLKVAAHCFLGPQASRLHL
jgi:TolB-like protein